MARVAELETRGFGTKVGTAGPVEEFVWMM